MCGLFVDSVGTILNFIVSIRNPSSIYVSPKYGICNEVLEVTTCPKNKGIIIFATGKL